MTLGSGAASGGPPSPSGAAALGRWRKVPAVTSQAVGGLLGGSHRTEEEGREGARGGAGNAPAWAGGASAGPAPSEAVDDAIPRSMVVDGSDAEALLAIGEGKFCIRDLSPMP